MNNKEDKCPNNKEGHFFEIKYNNYKYCRYCEQCQCINGYPQMLPESRSNIIRRKNKR